MTLVRVPYQMAPPLKFASASARFTLPKSAKAAGTALLVQTRPVSIAAMVSKKNVDHFLLQTAEIDAVVVTRYQTKQGQSWVDLGKPVVDSTGGPGLITLTPPVGKNFRALIDVYSFDGKHMNASTVIDIEGGK